MGDDNNKTEFDNKWKKSLISIKYPTNRDLKLYTTHSWLEGRREDDNAEGLWRIYDGIYDFTEFINRHPGGSFWIKNTQGLDITEAFEAHHISKVPEKIIEKYKIRDASKPRNITLTLKDDGFYKTLKSRVREKLKTIDYTPSKTSDIIHSALLIITYFIAIQCAAMESVLLMTIAGVLICWTTITAHNYFHRRDNWRMYTFNLSLMNYTDWRISHALSHHLFTNSFHDMELALFEPFFVWIPNPKLKNWIQRYLSWIYGPLFVYPTLFIRSYITRIIYSIVNCNIMEFDDLIPFTVPLAMNFFSNNLTLFECLKYWIGMICISSFSFSLIGLNAAHHHPEIYHDGDTIRDDRDWGLYQLDTIMDRSDLKGSQFMVLTHFGDHGLHHLFPTLDHGILPQLYPILYQTLEEFNGALKECRWLHHIIGQHQQLARIIPNPLPPVNGGRIFIIK